MLDDAALLHRYIEEGSDDAFRELVQRHLSLVYGAALRRTNGDTHRAEDVTQIVFTHMARQARTLSKHRALTAWLYAATRNVAIKLMLSEKRREAREQEHVAKAAEAFVPEPTVDWNRIRPILDGAMDDLGTKDREAILLRFFEGRTYKEVSDVMSLTEDAVRMRVSRGLETLRNGLARHGVASTSAVLGVLLASHATPEAPVGVASGVSNAALAGGGGGAAPVLLTALSIGKFGAIAMIVATILSLGVTGYRRAVRAPVKPSSALDRAARSVSARPIAVARGSVSGANSGPEVSLDAILAEPDQIKAFALFARHLQQLRAADFVVEFPTIRGIGKPEQYDMFFHLFVRRWGEVDPMAALSAVEAAEIAARPFSRVQTAQYAKLLVLRGWALEDVSAPVEWAIQQAGDFRTSPVTNPNLGPSAARSLAGELTFILGGLVDTGNFSSAAELLSRYGHVLSEIAGLTGAYGGPYRDLTDEVRNRSAQNALPTEAARLLQAWAQVDPIAAGKWIDAGLPGETDKSLAIVGYMRGVAAGDPEIAVKMVDSFQDPAMRSAGALALVEALSGRGLSEKAFDWLMANAPNNAGGALDRAIYTYVNSPLPGFNGPALRGLIDQVHAPDVKVETARNFVRSSQVSAPAEAIQAIREFLPESDQWATLPGSNGRGWLMTTVPFVVSRWSTRDYDGAVAYVNSMTSLAPEQRATLLDVAAEARANK